MEKITATSGLAALALGVIGGCGATAQKNLNPGAYTGTLNCTASAGSESISAPLQGYELIISNSGFPLTDNGVEMREGAIDVARFGNITMTYKIERVNPISNNRLDIHSTVTVTGNIGANHTTIETTGKLSYTQTSSNSINYVGTAVSPDFSMTCEGDVFR